jgi:hypothetical protein
MPPTSAMVELDLLAGRVVPMRMDKQQQTSDHTQKEQGSRPGRIPSPTDPAECLAQRGGRGENSANLCWRISWSFPKNVWAKLSESIGQASWSLHTRTKMPTTPRAMGRTRRAPKGNRGRSAWPNSKILSILRRDRRSDG